MPQFDQLRRLRVFRFKSGESRIERDQTMTQVRSNRLSDVQVDNCSIAAMFLTTFAPRRLDENPPHRLGGGGEEMTAIVPARRVRRANEPQIRLMNECRRIQCV